MLFKKHFTKLTITYLNYTFESVCVTLHLNSYYLIKTLRPCFFFGKSKYEDTCKKSSIDKKNHQTPTKYIKATIL